MSEIKQRREALRPAVTQLELAKQAHVSLSTISNVERGYMPERPSIVIARIENALKVLERNARSDA